MPKKIEKQKIKDWVEAYKRQVEKELGVKTYNPKATSREYQEFKKE